MVAVSSVTNRGSPIGPRGEPGWPQPSSKETEAHMRALLGYDARMRRWSALSAISLAVVLVASTSAQINGVAPSVTSYGFGGHTQPNAPRASVTSLGPNGWSGPRFGTAPVPNRQPHYGHHTYPYYPAYYPYYSVIDPTVYGGPVDGAGPGEDDDQYQGGPTIFDRRGNGERYRTDARSPAPAPAESSSVAEGSVADRPAAPPEPAQPHTVLVFKDGHKQQVSNYAIVGASLFDLSSGHRQKIAISDLDVAATQKANEDQGIEFKLPTLPAGS
jgi:hypothetical protein